MREVTPRPNQQPVTPQSPGAALEVHLVRLRRRHLRAVMRIEAQVYPRPWTIPLFLSELNMRTTRYYLAARVGGAVVGYAGLMFVGDEGHVTNIAVDPAWQHRQIGTRLLLQLAREALAVGARHLTLEVRMSNKNAQQMYRKFGFASAGIRKNYYAETHEDALVMWAHDIDGPAYAERLASISAGIKGTTVLDAAR